MQGGPESPGVTERAINDIFRYVEEKAKQREFAVKVSYIEVGDLSRIDSIPIILRCQPTDKAKGRPSNCVRLFKGRRLA